MCFSNAVNIYHISFNYFINLNFFMNMEKIDDVLILLSIKLCFDLINVIFFLIQHLTNIKWLIHTIGIQVRPIDVWTCVALHLLLIAIGGQVWLLCKCIWLWHLLGLNWNIGKNIRKTVISAKNCMWRAVTSVKINGAEGNSNLICNLSC